MPAKGPTGKADILFSKLVRERAGHRCFAAVSRVGIVGQPLECYPVMQCAHIISRTYRAVRWDFTNAVCMCAAHHAWYTHHPLEWEDFIRAQGVDWDALKRRALFDPPEAPLAALARLKAISAQGVDATA